MKEKDAKRKEAESCQNAGVTPGQIQRSLAIKNSPQEGTFEN